MGLTVGTGQTMNVSGLSSNQNTIHAGAGGLITINGNFTNLAAGIIAIDIGGTSTSQFGRINITGSATLAGTLQVSYVNGFLPSLSQRFSILTFASRTGTFGTILGNDAGNGIRLDTDYQTTKLDLVGVAS